MYGTPVALMSETEISSRPGWRTVREIECSAKNLSTISGRVAYIGSSSLSATRLLVGMCSARYTDAVPPFARSASMT